MLVEQSVSIPYLLQQGGRLPRSLAGRSTQEPAARQQYLRTPVATRCHSLRAGLLSMLLLSMVAGCGGDDAKPPEAGQAGGSGVGTGGTQAAPADPSTIPLPKYTTAELRVYTTPADFQVLVDGQLVRAESGEPVLTPCAVTIDRGSHHVTVAREGYSDEGRLLTVEGSTEAEFEPVASTDSGRYSLLNSPWFETPVAEPIPLDSLNSAGSELDPYVTPDGLSIFFPADRADGRGIYLATRPSVWHPFDPPQLITLTRSSDLPASPSITADALTVVYAVPEQARIWSVTRPGPLSPFDDRVPVRFNARTNSRWLSAQILPDALRLYWVEADSPGDSANLRGLAAVRREAADGFDSTLEYPLPGLHPALSRDGLRQYLFDGQTLKRARRASVRESFSRPEVIASLKPEGYVHTASRRQWWLMDNEQWLFYCDDPNAEDPNLWAVRVFEQPGWGFHPVGRAIPPKPKVVASTPADSPGGTPKEPSKPKVDPRTLPLPYAVFREKFVRLAGARDYAAAKKLLDEAEQNAALADDRGLLAWDRQDLAQLQQVLANAERGAGTLKPGDTVRLGSVRLDFVRFAEGELVAKSKTKEVTRRLAELDTSNVVDLAELAGDPDNAEFALRVGTFLHYEPDGGERAAASWLERAGGTGQRFGQRLRERRLHLARQELARNNRGAGLLLLRNLVEQAPESAEAATAEELIEQLYTSFEWTPRGSRRWGTPVQGTWVADLQQSAGSLLVSPEKYGDFELTLEWKVDGRTAQGGVYFRWPGGGQPGETAFKIHLANDAGIPADQFTTGSLFKLSAPRRNAARAGGQWNTLRLVVRGEHVRAEINGSPVLDTDAADPEIPLKGYVALDGSIGGITYRRILLIDLPPEPDKPGSQKPQPRMTR